MDYDDLKKDLPSRTLDILENYQGEYEVTLLINCLVALLILPWERFSNHIPDVDIENLQGWGLTREHVKKVRCNSCGYNLKEIVRHMRNATAHMRIKTIRNNNNEIEKLIFKDKSSFEAEIPIANLKTFVIKLNQSIVENDLLGTAHSTN
jgi:hypothetical protein